MNKTSWFGSAVYRIKVKGKLSSEWNEWFSSVTIETENMESILTGKIKDQSELHGILVRIRDLGLPLISLERISEE